MSPFVSIVLVLTSYGAACGIAAVLLRRLNKEEIAYAASQRNWSNSYDALESRWKTQQDSIKQLTSTISIKDASINVKDASLKEFVEKISVLQHQNTVYEISVGSWKATADSLRVTADSSDKEVTRLQETNRSLSMELARVRDEAAENARGRNHWWQQFLDQNALIATGRAAEVAAVESRERLLSAIKQVVEPHISYQLNGSNIEGVVAALVSFAADQADSLHGKTIRCDQVISKLCDSEVAYERLSDDHKTLATSLRKNEDFCVALRCAANEILLESCPGAKVSANTLSDLEQIRRRLIYCSAQIVDLQQVVSQRDTTIAEKGKENARLALELADVKTDYDRSQRAAQGWLNDVLRQAKLLKTTGDETHDKTVKWFLSTVADGKTPCFYCQEHAEKVTALETKVKELEVAKPAQPLRFSMVTFGPQPSSLWSWGDLKSIKDLESVLDGYELRKRLSVSEQDRLAQWLAEEKRASYISLTGPTGCYIALQIIQMA